MVRALLPLLLFAAPAFAADEAPHSGRAGTRSAPELSDVALFVVAAAGVVVARRAMRRRFRARD